MVYGVGVWWCVGICGGVWACVGRCACEVWSMQRCGITGVDVCDLGVGCVCLVCATVDIEYVLGVQQCCGVIRVQASCACLCVCECVLVGVDSGCGVAGMVL
jgi:hypothetical protein